MIGIRNRWLRYGLGSGNARRAEEQDGENEDALHESDHCVAGILVQPFREVTRAARERPTSNVVPIEGMYLTNDDTRAVEIRNLARR